MWIPVKDKRHLIPAIIVWQEVAADAARDARTGRDIWVRKPWDTGHCRECIISQEISARYAQLARYAITGEC